MVLDPQTAIHRLDPFDTFSYVILGVFAMLCSLALFFLHVFKKELRKQPGGLIAMIAFSEFWLSLHWFLSGIRTEFVTDDYEEDSFFCKFNSFIAVNAASFEITYNLCLITYVFFKVRNSLRQGFMPKYSFHVFCWTITIVTCVLNSHKMYSRNPYGTCSVKASARDIMLAGITILIAMCYALFVYLYALRKLPKYGGTEILKFRKEFTNYYKSFIKTTIFFWSIIFGSYAAQLIGYRDAWYGEYLFYLGRMGNTVKILTPIIIFVIRMEDPAIKQSFYAYYGKMYESVSAKVKKQLLMKMLGRSPITQTNNMFEKPVCQVDQSEPQHDDQNYRDEIEDELNTTGQHEQSTTDTDDREIDLHGEFDEEQNWMNLLPSKIKCAFTRTFVASIGICYGQALKSSERRLSDFKKGKKNKLVMRFELKGEDSMKRLQSEQPIMDCSLSVYFPDIFNSLLTSAVTPSTFRSSFKIADNEDNIKKAGESGGGASGELFMFTKDSKFIIKTITHGEFKIFKKIIQDYALHFIEHQDSLIGRIFGLFSFDFKLGEKPIKVIVMENLFNVNNDAILRKYDMKGSRHSRQVLHSYQGISMNSKIKEVMKDLDFEHIDKSISISKNLASDSKNEGQTQSRLSSPGDVLLQRLVTDVLFFRKLQIIDYSVIVAILDKYAVDTGILHDQLTHNSHHWIESANGNHVYVIGIIDYFQLYTFGKRAERFFKKVQKCNANLETSSQPPFYYGERFIDFMRKIVL